MARSRLLICLASACISVAALGLAAPAAHADETCTGTIGAVPVVGNVIVPPGASCELLGTTITGNVIVNQDSQLLTENANVAGNIQGEGALRIRIYNTLVTNIQLEKVTLRIIIGSDRTCKADPLVLGNIQLTENSAAIGICKMSVSEDVQLDKNTGVIGVFDNTVGENLRVADNTHIVRLRRNEVGENMQVNKNTGTRTILTENTVGMVLQCSDNVPPPIGFGNTAVGGKEGQCAGL
jgi:hypothetical protein